MPIQIKLHDHGDDDGVEHYPFPTENERSEAEGSDLRPDAEDSDFIRCPRCKRYCYAEAVSCPHCKHYLMDNEKNRKPLWYVVTVIVAVIIIFLVWVMMQH